MLSKAYLRALNKQFPKKGSAGHNLTSLWAAAGFCKRDIPDEKGAGAFYFEAWNTSIRYVTAHSHGGISTSDLFNGAKPVVGWLQSQIRRVEGRRRGRR